VVGWWLHWVCWCEPTVETLRRPIVRCAPPPLLKEWGGCEEGQGIPSYRNWGAKSRPLFPPRWGKGFLGSTIKYWGFFRLPDMKKPEPTAIKRRPWQIKAACLTPRSGEIYQDEVAVWRQTGPRLQHKDIPGLLQVLFSPV